jgi:Uma2 family endonuclease
MARVPSTAADPTNRFRRLTIAALSRVRLDSLQVAPGGKRATHWTFGACRARIPDLVVATGPVPDEIVWLPPEMVALAVEIVSKGSERTDRWLKPVEYAEAGIARFWRVEPDDTVVQFRLDGQGYVEYGSVALVDLLAGDVPDLS